MIKKGSHDKTCKYISTEFCVCFLFCFVFVFYFCCCCCFLLLQMLFTWHRWLVKMLAVCLTCMLVVRFHTPQLKWNPELKHHCPDTPRVLVGLKTDLREDDAVVSCFAFLLLPFIIIRCLEFATSFVPVFFIPNPKIKFQKIKSNKIHFINNSSLLFQMLVK